VNDRPVQPDGNVHGVIVAMRRASDDKLLVIRRAAGVASGGKIAFPGGAVEMGEAREAAARREVLEELGVTVELTGEVWRRAFPERSLVLWGYAGRWVSGALRPDPAEVAEAMWRSVEELAELEAAGASLPGTLAFAEAAWGA